MRNNRNIQQQTGNMMNNLSKPNSLSIDSYLLGTPFPVNKNDLIAHVTGNEAPYAVLKVLQRFESKQYGNATDVATLFTHLQEAY